MTDTPYTHVMWKRDDARVKSFSTASRAKGTVVTVQIEVTSDEGWALSDLLRHLHEAKREGQIKRSARPDTLDPVRTVRPVRPLGTGFPEKRSLPAPPLQLPYLEGEK